MPPRPKYTEPRKLHQAIEEYFEECEKKGGVFPDYAGMRLHCKLRKQDIDRMCDPEQTENAEAYIEIFEWARDRRECFLARKMVTDPKSASGCRSALAMPENGGYSDKPAENMDRKVIVKIKDEDAELFK